MMLKKIINIVGFLAIMSILVVGGIIRTQAVAGNTEIDEAVISGEGSGYVSPSSVEANSGEWVTLEGVVQGWDDESLDDPDRYG